MAAKLHLCLLNNMPIWEQLAIEEALLRADDKNYCIINRGSSPAIVLGISGNVQEHIHETDARQQGVTLVRRFSGGGTVIVDDATFFVSFIIRKSTLDFGDCPKKVMQWSHELYKPVFSPHNFSLRENDYTIDERKVGGNAQYFTKGGWVHHTTFLWDYQKERMQLLKMPPKMPEYRQRRNHEDFVERLKNYYPSIAHLEQSLLHRLSHCFDLQDIYHEEIQLITLRPHRRATEIL